MTAASVPIPDSPSASAENAAPAAAVTVPWERVEKFVGQFTHDIRNGLNALELQLTFLGEICNDPEAATEIKQLRGTLGEITRQLQAVKLKTGGVSAHPMEYAAADSLEDLRERFERLHAAAAGRVRWQPAELGAAVLVLDPELSITALLELLDNGLTLGGEEGEIAVAAAPAPHGRGMRLALRQTLAAAPEIAPGRWGREPLLSTQRGAYGLGLFRARRVLEAQGATLDAACDAGNVLTVEVVFPSPTASAAP